LLHSARSTLWLVPELVESLHEVLRDWGEESFIAMLPELRLAFADLTPRECDRVARTVIETIGEGDDGKSSGASLAPVDLAGFHEGDLLRGVEVNRQVLEILRQDGLEDYGG
jgi:hypothetical protein